MLRDLFSLFPAYAGVIPSEMRSNYAQTPFPRIRGGDPDRTGRRMERWDFSPHTRG